MKRSITNLIIYFLLPLILLVSGLLLCREKTGKVGRGIYSAFFGIVIFALAALRSFVGTDYQSYAQLYNYFNFAEMEEVSELAHEKGFVVPLKILCDIFEDYHAIFVVTAFFIAAAAAIYIYKFSSDPCISALSFVCFGMFFYSMNFIRQMIAGVIVMFAMEFIREKSFLRYLVAVMFAACFHWSALVMIPFYFILQIRLEPLVLGAYAAVSAMLLIFADDIIDLGLKTLYTKYLTDYTPDLGSGVSIAYLLCYGVLFISAFVLRKSLYSKNEMNSVYLSCLFFVVMFEMLGARYAMLSRFGLLFVMSAFMGLAPDLVSSASEAAKEKFPARPRLASALVYTAFALVAAGFYLWLIFSGSNGAVPYRTVFEYSREIW